MENGTEIPGLERTACVTYEQRVPEGALHGAELRAEDLLDISELCKLITQRPDGEAIAHKACPSWRKQAQVIGGLTGSAGRAVFVRG